jgi:hemoglobin
VDSRAVRRNLVVADIVDRTGIDAAMIERLVREFYRRARSDPLIGPIFERSVRDWDAHLERMCDFWSSVALMSGRYHGQPMVAHRPLPIDTPHFDRWLELFAETAHAVCPPAAAAYFIDRARRIADSLELGLAAQKGKIGPRRLADTTLLRQGLDRRDNKEQRGTLPADLKLYKRTAIFDETTIPAALRCRHRTRPGVWAMIRVIDGRLRYRELGSGAERILDPEHPGIVAPAQLHEVEPLGSVRFFIELYGTSVATQDVCRDKPESEAQHG